MTRSIEEEEEEEEGETRMRGRRSISRMGNGHLHDIGRVTPCTMTTSSEWWWRWWWWGVEDERGVLCSQQAGTLAPPATHSGSRLSLCACSVVLRAAAAA